MSTAAVRALFYWSGLGIVIGASTAAFGVAAGILAFGLGVMAFSVFNHGAQ